MSKNNVKLMKSQKPEKRMGMIIRIIPLVLLFLTAGLLQEASANAIETDSRKTLLLRQYSIEKMREMHNIESAKSNGVITIYFLTGAGHPVDANKFLMWIDEDLISVDGISFDTEKALVVDSNRLQLPFSFIEPLNSEYLESMIRILGQSNFQQAVTPISLYESSNHSIVLSLLGDSRIQSQSVFSSRKVSGTLVAKSYSKTPGLFSAVQTVKPDEEEATKGSFIYRNRFWLMGASALAISGTTAIISSAGSGPVYLPDPPGRP